MTSPPSLSILRIITRLNIGGPAQHVVYLTKELNQDIFKSKLVFGAIDRVEGDMSYLVKENDIAYSEVNSLKNESGLWGNLKAFVHLYRMIRREKPSIVHLHLLKARFLGGLAAKVAGVPLIVETMHGDLFSGYYGYFKTCSILMAERLLGHFVMDKVIAISESVKKNILKHYITSARKVEVIPLGLKLDKFLHRVHPTAGLKEKYGFQSGTRLVGLVGRMVPIKGHHFFLKAACFVLSKYPDAVFILVGSGELRESLELECQRLGIKEKIVFMGWQRNLSEIYADLDIVVMSSLNEGTPVSLVEAMAAGIPVVATNVGGVPDVIEDGVSGLLVPPKDPEAMADAIIKLLKDDNFRRSLVENGRTSVYPKYDLSRLTQDTKELYLDLSSGLASASVVDVHH